jgi:hypothetical protein
LWPALAVMLAESILSVALVAISSIYGPLVRKNPTDDSESEVEEEFHEEEADMRVVVGGVILSCISCVVLVGIVFGEEGIKWWATVVALLLASIFSVLGVRALGETDLNPLVPLDYIVQYLD